MIDPVRRNIAARTPNRIVPTWAIRLLMGFVVGVELAWWTIPTMLGWTDRPAVIPSTLILWGAILTSHMYVAAHQGRLSDVARWLLQLCDGAWLVWLGFAVSVQIIWSMFGWATLPTTDTALGALQVTAWIVASSFAWFTHLSVGDRIVEEARPLLEQAATVASNPDR